MIEFLKEVIGLYVERGPWFLELLAAHVRLSLMAIAIAGTLGLVIGIVLSEYRKAAPFVIGICNVFYTIPSISMLGILIPLLGIGDKNAVTAISIYALMPMVRNTYTGLTTVDKDILEAAKAMGSNRIQTLTRVTLPLAFPVILTGLRSMTVMAISMCGLASYIGASGLGKAIYRGISIYNPQMTFAGSILIALLALTADLLLGFAEKLYKKKRRMQ